MDRTYGTRYYIFSFRRVKTRRYNIGRGYASGYYLIILFTIIKLKIRAVGSLHFVATG
jgi:hypothetical protein